MVAFHQLNSGRQGTFVRSKPIAPWSILEEGLLPAMVGQHTVVEAQLALVLGKFPECRHTWN
jgi:hypothetical protein